MRANDLGLDVLRSCLMAVRDHYLSNNFLLKADKSQVSVLDIAKLRSMTSVDSVGVAAVMLPIAARTLKALGFTVDQPLSFNDHATVVAKLHNYHAPAADSVGRWRTQASSPSSDRVCGM